MSLFLLPYILGLLALFFITGHVVLGVVRISNSNPYLTLLAKLFTGLVAFVTIYSIIFSHGSTINLGFTLIAIAAFYVIRKDKLATLPTQPFFNFTKPDLRVLFEVITIALGWFFYQSFMMYKAGYSHMDADTVYYSKVVEYLNQNGIESPWNINQAFGLKTSIAPYHCFEIWLCAAIAKLSGGLAYTAYITAVIPILFTIVSVGLIAIFKEFFSTNRFNLLMPLLLLCHSHIIPFNPDGIEIFNTNPLTNYKTLPLYIVFILTILMFRRNELLALVILSSSVIMSVSVSVAVAGCLFFFVLRKLVTKQRGAYFLFIYLLSLVTFMAVFYFLQSNMDRSTPPLFDFTGITNHTATLAHIFIKSLGQLIYLFYIYVIVLGIYLFKTRKIKKYLSLILLCGSLIISGLLAWSLYFRFQDAAQLFVIPAIPILHLLILYLSVAMLAELKQQKIFALSIVLLLMVSGIESITTICNAVDSYKKQVYSDTYIKQVKEALGSMLNHNGVSITAASDYHSVFDKNPYFGEPGSYLKLMGTGFNTTSISELDMPFDSTGGPDYQREMFLGMSTPFFQFFANYKHNWAANDITVPDIQKEFITETHSGFAILSKHAELSANWGDMVTQTIVDSISGERFVILRPSLAL